VTGAIMKEAGMPIDQMIALEAKESTYEWVEEFFDSKGVDYKQYFWCPVCDEEQSGEQVRDDILTVLIHLNDDHMLEPYEIRMLLEQMDV